MLYSLCNPGISRRVLSCVFIVTFEIFFFTVLIIFVFASTTGLIAKTSQYVPEQFPLELDSFNWVLEINILY